MSLKLAATRFKSIKMNSRARAFASILLAFVLAFTIVFSYSSYLLSRLDKQNPVEISELLSHVLWGSVGAGVLLVGFIYAMLSRYSKPLRKLQSSKQFQKAVLPLEAEDAPNITTGYHDEVDNAVRITNWLHDQLQKSYVQLQASLREQKKSYLEARQIEEKNDAIYNASLDAVVVIDDKGIVIEFNAIAEQLLDWSRSEIVGKKMVDYLVPPHLRDMHESGMKRFLETGEGIVLNQRLELSAVRKGGQEFPIEISISPAKTAKGYIFVSYMRDITQRQKDQTELKLAAHAFDSTEGMFISDAKGHIIRTNRAFSEITGYEEYEVLGEKPRQLSSVPSDSAFHKEVWRTLIEEGQWRGESSQQRKNGEVFPVFLNITAVKNDDEEISHYVAHFFDMTEQKNNEEIIRNAQQQAELASESKSRFLATMSHEIRTPMNGVIGVLGLLRETMLDAKQAELVSTARDSGELLLSIINDILDFSKMEAGKLTLENNVFDVHHLFQQTIDILQPQAIKKALNISVHISHTVPKKLIGDGDRLRQVLLNLVNNALKFTNSGGITVTVDATEQNGRCTLYCDVVDTGIGIATAELDTLFDEFSMADQSHSRSHEGTGLGLAICKQLVKLMDGSISVSSQENNGTTFSFTVDMQEAPADTWQETDVMAAPASPSAAIPGNLRILLAEDNPANQMVLKTMLEFSGLRVDIVSDGEEAVNAVSKIPYDIVLMDISMPRMDGLTATAKIREMAPPTNKVTIIALTAHAIIGDKERFLSKGMDDFLSKPLTRPALLDCLQRCYSKIEKEQNSAEQGGISEPKRASLVDEHVLQQLIIDTSVDVLPQLLKFYIVDAKERLVKIQAAAELKDFYILEFEAHTLGSSAAAHSNMELCNVCRQLEKCCVEQDFEQASRVAVNLVSLGEKSITALEARGRQGFKTS